jgi:hypothetical protein
MRKRLFALFLTAISGSFHATCSGQTVPCLVTGAVVDGEGGSPLAHALVILRSQAGAESRECTSGSGRFAFAGLSPGRYSLEVDGGSADCGSSGQEPFKRRESAVIDLPVAGRLDFLVELWPLKDVWQPNIARVVRLSPGGPLARFMGPDVDATRADDFSPLRGNSTLLDSSVSSVLTPGDIRDLPLNGRDAFATLAFQSNVSVDGGTARALGLTVNGQRPTSNSFLLDGVDFTNPLTSGPALPVAPEAIQEFRYSIANFGPEFGRAGGFIANVVSKSGSRDSHGLLYGYGKHRALNANEFARNYQGLPRPPLKEIQSGLSVGGPLRPAGLFGSLSLDGVAFRSAQSGRDYMLPTASFVERILRTRPQSKAAQALAGSGLRAPQSPGDSAVLKLDPPTTLDRLMALPRLDYAPRGRSYRFLARLVYSSLDRPDLFWTPYSADNTAYRQIDVNLMGGLVLKLPAQAILDIRGSRSQGRQEILRGRPGTANLIGWRDSFDQPAFSLPGSASAYEFRQKGNSAQFVAGVRKVSGRLSLHGGLDILGRDWSNLLDTGAVGSFLFDGPGEFENDTPTTLLLTVDRLALARREYRVPQGRAAYAQTQVGLSLHASARLLPNLVVHAGLRYENLGAPRLQSPWREVVISAATGAGLSERIASAGVSEIAAGDAPFTLESGRALPRLGIAWSPPASSKWVLRAGYGRFLDRVFDTYWLGVRRNAGDFLSVFDPGNLAGYYVNRNLQSYLSQVDTSLAATPNSRTMLVEPRLLSPTSESLFASVHRELLPGLILEMTGFRSRGFDLLSANVLNRRFQRQVPRPGRPPLLQIVRPNSGLDDILYRANQGRSDAAALSFEARYARRATSLRIAWTWAHSIDNQSDVIVGDFDFSYLNQSGAGEERTATFTRQFNPEFDRGNSDYDQRHNLTWALVHELGTTPGLNGLRLLRNWRAASVGAVRTGFPYNVEYSSRAAIEGQSCASTGQPDETLFQPRASLIDPDPGAYARRAAAQGGATLLDRRAFMAALPAACPGNTGRNSFGGPGLWNVDFSLSRDFALRSTESSWRLTIRVDAFNVFNHANLNRPRWERLNLSNRESPEKFSYAAFGRQEVNTGFPALVPFAETPRLLQFMLRLSF